MALRASGAGSDSERDSSLESPSRPSRTIGRAERDHAPADGAGGSRDADGAGACCGGLSLHACCPATAAVVGSGGCSGCGCGQSRERDASRYAAGADGRCSGGGCARQRLRQEQWRLCTGHPLLRRCRWPNRLRLQPHMPNAADARQRIRELPGGRTRRAAYLLAAAGGGQPRSECRAANRVPCGMQRGLLGHRFHVSPILHRDRLVRYYCRALHCLAAVLRDEQPVPARRQVHRDREWWLPL